MIISQDGTVIRVPVESVRTTGRNTMGVRVMNLRAEDKVSSMARLVSSGGSEDSASAESLDGLEGDLELSETDCDETASDQALDEEESALLDSADEDANERLDEE
jgi:DNA gyrase subunit A